MRLLGIPQGQSLGCFLSEAPPERHQARALAIDKRSPASECTLQHSAVASESCSTRFGFVQQKPKRFDNDARAQKPSLEAVATLR